MLGDELSKAEYSVQESPLRRAVTAAIDWFTGIFDGAAGDAVSIWWYAVVGLGLVLVLALIAWGLVRLQPGRRVRRAEQGGVFDEAGVAAADYLARARRALAAGDFDGAVVDGYRALVARSIERFLLDDQPGMTARELAVALAGSFPDDGPALQHVATSFGAVRYGAVAASPADADRMLSLEERLRRSTPRVPEPA